MKHDFKLMAHDDQDKLAALAGILCASLFAAGLPLASRRSMDWSATRLLFFVGKHFGTGVILSTAFVHLLPDAFDNLAAAGPRWKHAAGITTLGALLAIFLIEYASTAYVEYAFSRPRVISGLPDATPGLPAYRDDPNATPATFTVPVPLLNQDSYHATRQSVRRSRHLHKPREPKSSSEIQALDRRTQMISILVLQLGIMLHSFVIGVTLAFTSGPEFTSLVVAIVFHQLFEGLSLGVRISELPTGYTALARLLVALFALTVPAGILTTLWLLPHAEPALAGALQAAGAGMLIYAGTVEMLAEDFGHNSDERLRGREGAGGIAAMLAGACTMAVLGIWA